MFAYSAEEFAKYRNIILLFAVLIQKSPCGSGFASPLTGVIEGSGSSQIIKLSNLFEKEIEKDKMRYNAEIGKARAFESAAFARIEGSIAKQRSQMEQISIVSSAGSSLLAMRG